MKTSINNNPSTYKTYLQNQQVTSYPNNRNLKIKSEYTKLNTQKQYQKQLPYQIKSTKNNQPSTINNIKQPHVTKPKRYKTYNFPEIQQQQRKINKQKTKNTYVTIPYNTQELNNNISKVLSNIQEIQSQFRKLSSQNSINMKQSNPNSLNMKQPKYYSFHQHNLNDDDRQQQVNNNNKKDGFLSQLMDKIKRPINYNEKNDDYITKQKTQLVTLIKTLNKKLNDRLKQVQKDQHKSNIRQSIAESKLQNKRRRIKTQVQQQDEQQSPKKKNQRSPSAMEFQKSLVQVLEEINTNQKLIDNMSHQLEFLNKKYDGYQRSLKNYNKTQVSVQQLKAMIKKKKQQISRIRKKKFLTQKSIMSIQKKNGNLFALNSTDISSTNCSTSTHMSNDILSSLKYQYTQCLKKRDKLCNKFQMNRMHLNRIQELKDKHGVNKQRYEQLAERLNKINNKHQQQEQYDDDDQPSYYNGYNNNKRSPTTGSQNNKKKKYTQQQYHHMEFIYKTKRSKLQMLINTINRNQQLNKRKYYRLLKQLQAKMIENNETQGQSQISSVEKSRVKSTAKRPIMNNNNNNYKQGMQIIQTKLDRSRQGITELQNKIQRLGKVGKIIKKVNNHHNNNNINHNDIDDQQQQQGDEYYQEQENDDQQQQDYEQQYEQQQEQSQFDNNDNGTENYSHIDSKYSQNLNNNNKNSFIKNKLSNNNNKSQTTPLNQNNHQYIKQNQVQNNHQRKISAPSSQFTINTAKDSKADRKDYPSSHRYNNNNKEQSSSQFLTQNDKSFHQGNTFWMDNSLVLSNKNYQGKKYIGKFKKQRIVQKHNIMRPQHNDMKKKKGLLMNPNIMKQPIIQQQIQATNSFQSSQYNTNTSNNNNKNKNIKRPAQKQKPKLKPNSQSDTTSQWDDKILNLLKSSSSQQEQQDNYDNNIQEEINDDEDQQYSSEFSPQRQSKKLLLHQQQTNKQQKQKLIKHKFSNKLYKSNLLTNYNN